MILEFSQNGYIRREFEITDTPSARELVNTLNHKTLGRGGWYWRSYRHSPWDGSSEWTMRDIAGCVRKEAPRGDRRFD